MGEVVEPLEQISDFIHSRFSSGIKLINKNTQLFDEKIIDSFALAELIPFLEEKFQIKIRPMEILPENFETINRIANFVLQKSILSKST